MYTLHFDAANGIGTDASQTFTLSVNATIVVTTTADTVTHSGISLRDAITTANGAAAQGRDVTITFDPSLAGQTITLAQGQLELSGAGAGTITIDGSSLSQPITISGGSVNRTFQVDSGVQAVLSGLVLTGGVVNEQFVLGGGGAIFNNGTLTVQGTTIAGNKVISGGGGAIDNAGTLTVQNSTITGNSADSGSGGIQNDGTLTATGSTFAGNNGFQGGAVYLDGASGTFVNCTFTGNNVQAVGGAIFDATTQPVTIVGCTFNNNSANPPDAAAIENITNSVMTISNSTITQNTGGIENHGTLTVSACTLTGNQPGAGLSLVQGTATLMDTIVAGNSTGTSPADIIGFVSVVASPNSSFNLIGDGTGSGLTNGVNHNLVGQGANPINPMLAPLGNNGGPTQTMALVPGSPAQARGGPVTTLSAAVAATAATIPVANAAAIAVERLLRRPAAATSSRSTANCCWSPLSIRSTTSCGLSAARMARARPPTTPVAASFWPPSSAANLGPVCPTSALTRPSGSPQPSPVPPVPSSW